MSMLVYSKLRALAGQVAVVEQVLVVQLRAHGAAAEVAPAQRCRRRRRLWKPTYISRYDALFNLTFNSDSSS